MRKILILLAAGLAACTTTPPATEPGDDGAAPAPIPGSTDRSAVRALHYTANLRVMESFPVQLAASMTVQNPTQSAVRLELPGGCPLLLTAYHDEARTRLAWDQSKVIMCTMQLEILDLQPGATREYTARSDARDVLGDSLPDGTYHMSARLVVNDTVVTRSLGAVQLAVPR